MSILSYNGGAVVSKKKKKVVIGKKRPLKVTEEGPKLKIARPILTTNNR